MKILVFSDPHANWRALEAVLSDAQNKFDQIICCGDLVGYNARPQEVLEWTRDHCSAVIRGNHDKVVAGLGDLDWFNEVAQEAALWAKKALSPSQMEYLHNLAMGPLKLEHFKICHGSPLDEDEYILSTREAAECFSQIDSQLTFFGHTHVQGGFFWIRGRVGSLPAVGKNDQERVLELEPDISYMVNPGSVGQPRDGDPRAAYAIFDSDQKTVSLRRVVYDIDGTAREIRDAGLPPVLAYRLYRGM